MEAFRPARSGRDETLDVRGLAHHLLRWGPESPEPVVLLHGHSDCAATFQFLVDELPAGWPLAALDWRGFGDSARSPGGYWFPDYYADLEAVLDALCPAGPARIVGHSMGANVAMAYAGLRPSRVAALVNLEGIGLARTDPARAPARFTAWLDELKTEPPVAGYASVAALAERVMKRNPRLTPARAAFIAECWSRPLPGGGVRLHGDPRHRRVNPVLYRREEMEACWRRIEAPVLLVTGGESEMPARLAPEGGVESFRAFVRKLELATVAGAGHMLHHDEPRAVARLIEDFFGQYRP
jgi:pimeloyl-ACP methyl ester carboxylesterase